MSRVPDDDASSTGGERETGRICTGSAEEVTADQFVLEWLSRHTTKSLLNLKTFCRKNNSPHTTKFRVVSLKI